MRIIRNNIVFLGLIILLAGCGSSAKHSEPPENSSALKSEMPMTADHVRPLLVGAASPSVKVRQPDGKDVELTTVLNGKPALVIFYRGGWCPYCNLQLGSLKKIEKDILKLGVQIVAISPDKPEELLKSVEKHKLGYTLLSDSQLKLAKAFGIAFQLGDDMVKKYREYKIDLEAASGENHHGLPVPSVFAIGRDGTIAYTYVNPNYKVRPSPDVVLAIARDIAQADKTKR